MKAEDFLEGLIFGSSGVASWRRYEMRLEFQARTKKRVDRWDEMAILLSLQAYPPIGLYSLLTHYFPSLKNIFPFHF